MSEQMTGPAPGWGAAAGHVDLHEAAAAPPGPSAALDRQLIVERIHRYGWACDELREDWLADCFTADATWRGNMMGAQEVGPIEGGTTIAAWLAEFFPQMEDQRRHLFINAVVQEQEAEHATAWANIIITGAHDGVVRLRSSGFYRLRLVKRDDAWLIAELFAGFDGPW